MFFYARVGYTPHDHIGGFVVPTVGLVRAHWYSWTLFNSWARITCYKILFDFLAHNFVLLFLCIQLETLLYYSLMSITSYGNRV